MGTFHFLSEVGVGTHIGRSTNDGFGLVDLVTGVISGSGCLATASKDLAGAISNRLTLTNVTLADLGV